MTPRHEKTTVGVIAIPAKVVKYVRWGARDEVEHNLSVLESIIHADTIDPKMYGAVAVRFDAARSLFEEVGISDDPRQADIELDLRRWPHLLLRVLEAQHDTEVRRLQDAAAEGFELPLRDVPALRALADEVRKRTGAAPRAGRTQSLIERSLSAPPRWRRLRDHG